MNRKEREQICSLLRARQRAITNDDGEMRRYWEGRIDGHCLQNAVGEGELIKLAETAGFSVAWANRNAGLRKDASV